MNINEFVFKYKKAIVIAAINVVGLVLLLVVVSLIRGAAAGSIPSANAPASETVAFLADPTMKLQPKEKRLQFMTQMVQVYIDSPQKREQFAQAINNLSDGEVAQLQDNVFEVAKDQIVNDAMVYSRLQTPEQKRAFVSGRVGQMSSLQSLLTGKSNGGSSGTISRGGNAGANGPDLRSTKVNQGVPSNPAAVYSKVLDHTNPSERSKVDSYISAVQVEANRAKKATKK
jgi:hypothetical protein